MSPRPRKQRCCEGGFLSGQAFKPNGVPLRQLKQIPLHRDELEALRLCDLEGLFQEQAGERMGVSRGTVQRLVSSARRKTAEAIVSGAALVFAEEDGQSRQTLPLPGKGAAEIHSDAENAPSATVS